MSHFCVAAFLISEPLNNFIYLADLGYNRQVFSIPNVNFRKWLPDVYFFSLRWSRLILTELLLNTLNKKDILRFFDSNESTSKLYTVKKSNYMQTTSIPYFSSFNLHWLESMECNKTHSKISYEQVFFCCTQIAFIIKTSVNHNLRPALLENELISRGVNIILVI